MATMQKKTLARRAAKDLLRKILPEEDLLVDYDAKVNLRDAGDGYAWVTVHVCVRLENNHG